MIYKSIAFKRLILTLAYMLLSVGYLYFCLRNAKIVGAHDIAFHINRILGLETIFQSPINFEVYQSLPFGFQVNHFYGWLMIYPAYLLITLCQSIVIGYLIYLVLITFLTFVVSHYAMYKISCSTKTSVLFALLYGFSGYRATDIFYRNALGEFIVFAFLPLILLGFYQLYHHQKKAWIPLTIGMSLILMTHVLTAVLTAFFIFVFYILLIFKNRNFQLVLLTTRSLVKAAGCSVLFTLFITVPMLEQMMYQTLKTPTTYILSERALLLDDIFSNSLNNNLGSYDIGLTLLIVLFLLIFRKKKFTSFEKVCFAFALFSIILTTKFIPWDIVQNTPVNFIQFPWRFFTYATLFVAFCGAHYISRTMTNKRLNHLLIGLMPALLVLNYVSIANLINAEPDTAFNETQITNTYQTKPTTAHDYEPINYADYEKQMENRSVMQNNQVLSSQYEINKTKITFEFTTNQPELVTLPVFKYKGLAVTVNDQTVNIENDSLSIVNILPESGSSRVNVFYQYTFLTKLADVISIISVVGFCLLVNIKKLDFSRLYRKTI